MRLLKLLAYSILGYVGYQIYQGFTAGQQSKAKSSRQSRGRSSQSGGSRELRSALNDDEGRSQNLTGREGSGIEVEAQDSGGGRARHTVGRGVIS